MQAFLYTNNVKEKKTKKVRKINEHKSCVYVHQKLLMNINTISLEFSNYLRQVKPCVCFAQNLPRAELPDDVYESDWQL